MEEHEHAMQRAAELCDAVYNGNGGRTHISLADAYIAMARELRIGTYRMTTGRGGGPKYQNVKVVIPNIAPNVVEEDEPPEEDVRVGVPVDAYSLTEDVPLAGEVGEEKDSPADSPSWP